VSPDEITPVCECGIKLQPYDLDGVRKWYCPRCQLDKWPEVAQDDTASPTEEEVQAVAVEVERMTGMRPRELRTATGSEPLAPCEQCGTIMRKKCGAICSNCKWIRPCSI